MTLCYIIYEKWVKYEDPQGCESTDGYWEDSFEVFGNVETAIAWMDNTQSAALCKKHDRIMIGPLTHYKD